MGSKNKVQGEGDYEGARDYDKRVEGFVKKNKDKIPSYAKNAEKALEGSEGASLRKAEEKGKSKARR